MAYNEWENIPYEMRIKIMWKENLELIRNEKKQYNEYLNNGIENKKIIDYITKFESLKIPKSYIEFLNKMNGFEFDGCVLYGIGNNEFEQNENVFDLFERNEIWHDTFDKEIYTFLGETNLCWYVYNKKTQKYNVLDLPSATLINECTTLDDMLDIFFGEINI